MTVQSMMLNNTQMVAALRDEHPELQTTGFWKAIVAAFPDFALDPRPFTRVRDAYAVRADDCEVDVFEGEITHPVPQATMRDWCRLWLDLDTFDVTMRMFVVNRYGHINEVPLERYYYLLEHPTVACA